MPIVSFSDRDILRGKILTPSWYRVRIDSVGQAPSASGTSINFPMEGTVLFDAESGSTEFAGCPTPGGWNFNDKALGFAIGFLQALGQEVTPGKRFELKSAESKEIDVFIENDTYQGRVVNRINHKYRKPVEKE